MKQDGFEQLEVSRRKLSNYFDFESESLPHSNPSCFILQILFILSKF